VLRLDLSIAEAAHAIGALQGEHHRHEMALVGLDAHLARAREDAQRQARRADLLALERRRAEDERAAFESRRESAAASIVELQAQQQLGEAEFGVAQRRLAEAREAATALAETLAEARAVHAGLVERAAAHVADVSRLEDGARDLEARVLSRQAETDQARIRRDELLTTIADGERGLDEDVLALEGIRTDLVAADERATERRATVHAQDDVIRDARRALEAVRAQANEIDIARATAESDLSHLAQTSVESVQASLDDVLAEVESMELAGEATVMSKPTRRPTAAPPSTPAVTLARPRVWCWRPRRSRRR
jgi:hypothetical protein